MSLTGTTLPYFAEAGDGPCAVLMLHGIGGSHGAFLAQMEPLASAGYRALAWDAPGYSFSRSVEPYSIETLAQAVVDLIGIIEADHLVLVGHSMGGMIAQAVVALRPELVHGLVLVATSPAFGRAEGSWQREFLEQRLAPLERGVPMAELADTLVAGMVGPAASAEAIAHARAIMAGVSAATYRHALTALVSFDARAALPDIAVPTLLVAGEADTTAPVAVMQKMGERIRGSEFVTLAGSGHIVPIEVPDAFNDALIAFLRHHFPGDGTLGPGA
jgi:3-oxoadipate enol-lactonase